MSLPAAIALMLAGAALYDALLEPWKAAQARKRPPVDWARDPYAPVFKPRGLASAATEGLGPRVDRCQHSPVTPGPVTEPWAARALEEIAQEHA